MATPSKNLRAFMEYVKANEGKVAAGTGGAGTPAHLSAVYFQQKTGAKFEIVHYRSPTPRAQRGSQASATLAQDRPQRVDTGHRGLSA